MSCCDTCLNRAIDPKTGRKRPVKRDCPILETVAAVIDIHTGGPISEDEVTRVITTCREYRSA
jgi:hypothetical protein